MSKDRQYKVTAKVVIDLQFDGVLAQDSGEAFNVVSDLIQEHLDPQNVKWVEQSITLNEGENKDD